MDSLKNIMFSYKGIDNNIDIRDNNLNIDKSIDSSKYALKDNFIPRTNEEQTAKEIAAALKDTDNYAFYLWSVQKISSAEAIRLLKETQNDVKRRENFPKPIENPGALFHWKVNKYLYEQKQA